MKDLETRDLKLETRKNIAALRSKQNANARSEATGSVLSVHDSRRLPAAPAAAAQAGATEDLSACKTYAQAGKEMRSIKELPKDASRSRMEGASRRGAYLKVCDPRGATEDKEMRSIFGQRERGFSLVELIVILSVMSILAGIAIPQYLRTKERVKVQSGMGLANALRVALKMYSTENLPNTKLPVVYPDVAAMGNLDSIYTVLSPYLPENPKARLGGNGFAIYEAGQDPDFTEAEYIVYQEVTRTLFTLTVKASDKAQTLITATPASVYAVFDGETLNFP